MWKQSNKQANGKFKHNIGVFKKIEAQHDSIDMFITNMNQKKLLSTFRLW